VCIDGVCCADSQACGSTCCADGDVCSFGACQTPGGACVDAADCGDGYYCEYVLGEPAAVDAGPSCTGGVVPPEGRCLPRPPVCPDGQPPGDPPTCLESCEYHPPTGSLEPVLKYSWGSPTAPATADSVMMAPVVIQLDDDNCDGTVDERDIPEIVFLTFASGSYNTNGTLHAISIVDGQVVEKWNANAGATSPNHPGRSIAAGNIDGVPGNEIVVCTADGRARAYRADGTELWLSPVSSCFMPSIADVDHDGDVEVVIEGAILDGATGALVTPLATFGFSNVVVADVTGDATVELVGPSQVLAADGTSIAATGVAGRYVAVGDLDRDGTPEIVASDYDTHALVVWHVDAAAPGGFTVIRQGLDINGPLSPALCAAGSAGNTRGGGPPTVADFNGDGFPDVALAGGVGYAVFDGKKLMDPTVADAETVLWVTQTQDCSSAATGSSVFDFDGDGRAEVVYGDELYLHVYDGTTGANLFQTCNTNGTLFEYPLVADVDNDGQADIVVVSNSYSGFNCGGMKTAGVRIFGDAAGNWVRTRRVWNEHAYHVTNVAEDGTIPQQEQPNHLQPGLDNFRQNVQPSAEFAAPDLVVDVFATCSPSYGLVARVRNLGEAAVPPGVPVNFYVGDPGTGGTLVAGSPVVTQHALYPAEAELVTLPVAAPYPSGTTIYAVVDEGAAHAWHECDADNNTSAAASAGCNID
ncbi:MAG: VCBS repeat-containing protein, partial [Myxococcales bacterium]|nr:VCBS repeat-containing protein [Myxococcales bacterium]